MLVVSVELKPLNCLNRKFKQLRVCGFETQIFYSFFFLRDSYNCPLSVPDEKYCTIVITKTIFRVRGHTKFFICIRIC